MEAGREVRVPDASLQYLVDYLFEVGPTGSGGFGPVPLSFQEIEAWSRLIPRGLQPWEVQYIRRLSIEWCAASDQATDPDMPPPWSAPVTDDELRRVARSLRDSIGDLTK